MSKVYFGDWAEPSYSGKQGREAMEKDFNVKLPDSVHILFAYYGQRSYEGSAYVLFEQDGKLFEVAASHCSCYGLEDQWSPAETVAAAARTYLKDTYYYVDDETAKQAALRALDRFEQRVAA